MKRSTILWLAVLLLPLPFVRTAMRDIRSVVPFSPEKEAAASFDPAQSVALFVGIGKFADETLSPVRFAVDDAVDLAYAFTLGANTPLVPADRVVIAITGQPSKQASKDRLAELKKAGATIETKVDQPELLKLLRGQATRAGRDGLFIVSFATHGFTSDGVAYLLGEESLFRDLETTLSAAKVSDIVGRSDAARSLIIIDACRERVNNNARAGSKEPLAAAPLLSAMKKVAGQVIFYAAANGGYAYDDEKRGNGVFTAAVIDSMECSTGKNQMITVEKLAGQVESKVRAWVRKHREWTIQKATQISTEGSTGRMPLVSCSAPKIASSFGDFGTLANVTFDGATLIARNEHGGEMWRRTAPGAIRMARVDELLNKSARGVVAMSVDAVSIYDDAGKLISTYRHAGVLQHLEIYRPTGRYNPKIIVTGTDAKRGAAIVLKLDPKKAEKPVWYGMITPRTQRIDRLDVIDYDENRQRDLALHTSGGKTIHLDSDGHRIDSESVPSVQLITSK